MSSKLLITQFAVGPTHKLRLLHNLRTKEAYGYFDVLVLTDTVETFHGLAGNIMVRDINEIRKDYPWSIEYEKLPIERHDEAIYAQELQETGLKIPTCMRRFAFALEGVERYDGFLFLDCDVYPICDDLWYNKMQSYFCNPMESNPEYPDFYTKDRIIVIPASSPGYDLFHHPFLLEYAKEINDEYHISNEELVHKFITTDGNFRTIKFPTSGLIKPFFNLMNNIIHDVLVKGKYFHLRGGSMWSIHSEYLMAIMLNLYGGEGFPMTHGTGIYNSLSFRIDCYPEDRFWNWGMHMEGSIIGKMDFVQKNYDNLKTFYENRNQVFDYERIN